MKLKKGDEIRIISGNDKGKQGKILSVIRSGGKIIVEGLNIKKKHVRPRKQGQKGELVKIPGAFPASRAMMVCPRCGRAVRLGYRLDAERKARVCKKCGAEI